MWAEELLFFDALRVHARAHRRLSRSGMTASSTWLRSGIVDSGNHGGASITRRRARQTGQHTGAAAESQLKTKGSSGEKKTTKVPASVYNAASVRSLAARSAERRPEERIHNPSQNHHPKTRRSIRKRSGLKMAACSVRSRAALGRERRPFFSIIVCDSAYSVFEGGEIGRASSGFLPPRIYDAVTATRVRAHGGV